MIDDGRRPLPPAAAVLTVDAVNRGDVDALDRLVIDDHVMTMLDVPPTPGREAVVEGGRGYDMIWPDYVITPPSIVEGDGWATVLGHTTGSHLDDVERQEALIGHATVVDGRLAPWTLFEDTPENRSTHGLD